MMSQLLPMIRRTDAQRRQRRIAEPANMSRVLVPARSRLALLGIVCAGAVLGGGAWALAADPASTAANSGQAHPAPARTKGWSWKTPPDWVKPDCGKRNPLFYVGEPITFTLGPVAVTYEVRNYWGDLVDQGAAGAGITVKAQPPGWYKLYVYGKGQIKESKDEKDAREMDVLLEGKPQKTAPLDRNLWQDIVGGTTFVVFRKDARFPELPPKGTSGGGGTGDEVMRAVSGMGPQRHGADASKPDESIKQLEAAISIDRAMYLPSDPVRKRALMIAFPNGTKDKLDGVKKIVEHFKNDVKYWEPRNEPNFGSSGADFVKNELIPFYETVKAVDPNLKVMGPGTVGIGPQLQGWLEDFFKADGGKYIDVFSFHIYNGISGDIVLGRLTMETLQATLARYGLEKIEKWQTEQGYFAAIYGSYQPRLQGRWTLLEMMLFEQYGIPKEHNHLWYDVSHGFWDFPTWWENEDGGFNPALPLMRVWSEELFGKTFVKAYDFGRDGNKLCLGSLFTGADGSVAAFMNVGCGMATVELKVSGGGKLKVVSAFGVESELPVTNGTAKLPVPEIPVYVELAKGQTLEVVPVKWGTNLARLEGVTVKTSGTGEHPVDKKIPNNTTKIINGVYEQWYWNQKPEDQPWMDNTPAFPAWIEISLLGAAEIDRVVVFSGVPWQWAGTLVDYELQYDDGGKWVTLERVQEPLKTFGVYTPPTRTSVDSFFADRWIFEHVFKPVKTQKIRLLVHNTTFGGGASELVPEAGGQTGPHQVMLREVEIYGR